MKFRFQAVEEKLADTDQAAWRDALKAKAHLEKAIQEVRRISRNLRPSELDDLGLPPALRSLCAEFSERTGVPVDLSIARLPPSIPNDIELNLYRIVQEALGNVEKHARATRVELLLSREGSQLRATIRDDGRGFDAHAPPGKRTRPAGMGLVDMRERAAFVGGTCRLTTRPGQGTEIVVEMPMKIVDPLTTQPGEKGKA